MNVHVIRGTTEAQEELLNRGFSWETGSKGIKDLEGFLMVVNYRTKTLQISGIESGSILEVLADGYITEESHRYVFNPFTNILPLKELLEPWKLWLDRGRKGTLK